jgi:hypothetical protein
MIGGGKKINMLLKPLVLIVILGNLALYALHVTRKAMALKNKVIKNDQLARFDVTTFYSSHLILIVANTIFAFLTIKNNTKLAFSLILLLCIDVSILIYFSVLASKAKGKEVLIPGAYQFSEEYQQHTIALLTVYSVAAAVSFLALIFIFQ